MHSRSAMPKYTFIE